MSGSDQTAARLLNLIIALMVHPRGLSREQLMAVLEITEERTFERTKDALRSALGVALEESDQGHYRLGGAGYAMPPLQFTPPEHAAIALALGAWRGSEIEWAARGVLTKLAPLEEADLRPDPADGLDLALYAPTEGAAPLIGAIADRRRVRFDHVTGATGQLARRHVEPWRLAKRGGIWYLYGFDLDRQAERVFNLRRIIGPVTPVGQVGAFDPPAPAAVTSKLAAALDRPLTGPSLVWAVPAAAHVLALQGAHPSADGVPHAADAFPAADAVPDFIDARPAAADDVPDVPAAAVAAPGTADAVPAAGLNAAAAPAADAHPLTHAGRALWRVPSADPFELAAWGAQLEVVEPASLREEVQQRWRGAARAHRGEAEPPLPYQRPARSARRNPKERGAARAARLVSVVSYLGDRGTVTLAELAERFDVSPEEIHRDLYLLWTDVGRSRAGGDLLDFAWSEDESEVALIDSQGLDRPARLSQVEAITLIAALRSVEEAGGLSEASAAASARVKLEEALGTAAGVDFNLPQGGPTLETVRQAITQNRRLTFDYVNQAGDLSQRRVDPLELFSAQDHWLFAAWDLDAEAERHFRLDRMANPQAGDEPAETHPYRPRRTGWSNRAELVVDAVFAPRERWRAEELETLAPPLPLAGGALQVRLGVVNPAWITAMALGAGGGIEVLAPAELRERIAKAAAAALR
ncbi:MAG: WYL domain-containing protein [Bifidobacteriaceae bacterium]|nr:WYL domain-containing protein [Bifidobacteriaceae bacterium]